MSGDTEVGSAQNVSAVKQYMVAEAAASTRRLMAHHRISVSVELSCDVFQCIVSVLRDVRLELQ